MWGASEVIELLSARRLKFILLGLSALFLLLILYLLQPNSAPDPAIWGGDTSTNKPETTGSHDAATIYKMCRSFAADRDFRARLMSIPLYPDDFCGCVARLAYREYPEPEPYGTDQETSF